MHRRGTCFFLRASSASAKTPICATVEEAINGVVARWKRFTWVMQEPQVVKVMGLCLVYLYHVKVLEKGAAVSAATTCGASDCGWVMGVVVLCGRDMSAGGAWSWGLDLGLELGIDLGLR